MPAIEVRMLLDTEVGQMHINFFTAIKNDFDHNGFYSELNEKLQEVVNANDEIANSGHAIISHMGTELFTVFFMRGAEGNKWIKKIMMNQDDPIIH